MTLASGRCAKREEIQPFEGRMNGDAWSMDGMIDLGPRSSHDVRARLWPLLRLDLRATAAAFCCA